MKQCFISAVAHWDKTKQKRWNSCETFWDVSDTQFAYGLCLLLKRFGVLFHELCERRRK